jgi:hypothetical protein
MVAAMWAIARRRLLLVALHVIDLVPKAVAFGLDGASNVTSAEHLFLKRSVDHAAFLVSSGMCSLFSSSGAGSLSGGSLSHDAHIATAHMNAVRAQRVTTGSIGTALLPRRLAFTPPTYSLEAGPE